ARLDDARPHPTPQAYVGAVAAGEKVFQSTQSSLYTLLKAKYNVAALEMEGAGIFAPVQANHAVHGLVIRGIADLIDDKSHADATQMAARHAAAFAFQVLTTFTLPAFDSTLSPTVWNVPQQQRYANISIVKQEDRQIIPKTTNLGTSKMYALRLNIGPLL